MGKFVDMPPTRKMAIDIIDMFEELLEQKSCPNIPDEDREGNDYEAVIYGKTYFDLEDRITSYLDRKIKMGGVK